MSVLDEIARLGAEQSALALSALLGLPVSVNALTTAHVTAPAIIDLGREVRDNVCVGVHFSLHGQRIGNSLLVFPRADACQFADIANRKPVGTTSVLDEYAQSTVREISDIMAGAFLAGTRKVAPALVIHSVPRLVIDRWPHIAAALLASVAPSDQPLEFIECELVVEAVNAGCMIMMVVTGRWDADSRPSFPWPPGALPRRR